MSHNAGVSKYQSDLGDGYRDSSLGILVGEAFERPLDFPLALHDEPVYHVLELPVEILRPLCFYFFVATRSSGRQ